MVKNNISLSFVLTRSILVAVIVLSFVGIVYYVSKDKRTCAEKNQVDNPNPNKKGCLDKCISDPENPKEYRCKTSKCKRQWYKKIEKAVCADCDEGKIPIKDNETGNYKCVPECNNNENSSWVCSDGETCKHLSNNDEGSPSYCASTLYKCVKDDIGNRGHYCTPVTPGSGGMPLDECLNKGNADGDPCSCNHKQGYALNSANTACNTIACTLDGLNGWGSHRDRNHDPKPNEKGRMSLDPNPNTGTCYALDDENGLLLDPKAEKSKKCSSNTKAQDCLNMNAEGWKCKWLLRVRSCSPNLPTNCLIKKGFVPPSDNFIRYGDDIILSIDNNLFSQSRLLFSCGKCSDFDSSVTTNKNELMTFVGKYGGESSSVRTDTITFKIVPTFSIKDKQKAADDLMGKVLNTNDAFHLRAKYGDSNRNQPSYYYLTEAQCTPKIYGKYKGNSSTFQKLGAKGYTSLGLASSITDKTVPTATLRFVDPAEDDLCTATTPQCDQDSTPVTSKKAYRLKFSESSTYPYYVGLGDNPLSFGNSSNRLLTGCRADFLVTFGPRSKRNWYIMKPQSIIQGQCPHFFNDDGSPKTNEQIGGYNPA